MPPNNVGQPLQLENLQDLDPPLVGSDNNNDVPQQQVPSKPKFKPRIKWFNVIFITLFHLIAAYGIIFTICKSKTQSLIWGYVVGTLGGFGVTGGVHRLWAHRSYKAKLPLQIILVICYTIAGQNTIYDWVRDHRVHHKFSETDADPHNANRGFFFAHVGWLMQRKHPEVVAKGAQVDMSDITGDPVLAFHTKHFSKFKLLLCFFLPTIIPIYCWGEDPLKAIIGMAFVRYMIGLNITWLVNSAAHMWGNRPFDKRISPAQNKIVSMLSMGEGWHNYHHVFPWDYKAAEFGFPYNMTTIFLNFFARIGWAYDLKAPSPELIKKVALRHGDGTYHSHEEVPYEEELRVRKRAHKTE